MISIILTTCCVTDYRLSLLKLSVKSLLDNTSMMGKQWIICDNGDQRQTDYIKTLNPQHEHLVFGANMGIAYARNAGAKAAKGDYFCFLDGDLIYRPNWLRTLKRLLNNKKLIASGMINENLRTTYKGAIDHGLHWQIWLKANSGCLLMSRKAWDEIGPWSNFWKLGSSFCRAANRKRYRFIVPIPEVVSHLDNKSSYSKRRLQVSRHSIGGPIWEMVK